MVWDLARGEEFLPDFSFSELKQQAMAEKRKQPHLRLLVALNRKEGKSIDKIANAVSLHRRAVHDILHRFEERGLGAANGLPKPGRTKRLTIKQLKDLRKRLLQEPVKSGFEEGFWNGRMVQELVRKQYDVHYCSGWLPKVLARLGFSYKKPRPTNPRRASPEEIAAFKKKRTERYWLPNEKKKPGL
jgi:putative transposase